MVEAVLASVAGDDRYPAADELATIGRKPWWIRAVPCQYVAFSIDVG